MSGYRSKADADAYVLAEANYQAVRSSWEQGNAEVQAIYDAMLLDYEQALAVWVPGSVYEDGSPIPEPQPPEAPTFTPEPQAPAPPFTYEGRDLIDPEQLTGEFGPMLVVPPKTMLTAPSGLEFAVDPDALARDYVAV